MELPATGSKRTSVDFQPTQGDPVTVHLVLHGAEVKVPYVVQQGSNLQLEVDSPGAVVADVIEVITVEDKDAPPWIQSMIAEGQEVHVELLELKAVAMGTDGEFL